MKKLKSVSCMLAFALTVGAAFTVHVQAADPGKRPLRGFLVQRAKEHLGLTPSQINGIKAVITADKEILIKLLDRLHDTRIDLRETIQSPEATETSVRAASAEVAAAEADIAVERWHLYQKISPILTPDQREEVQRLLQCLDDWIDHVIRQIGDWPAD